MQDRSPPARQNPPATNGRTIHLGQTGKNSVRAAFQLCPQTRTLLDAFGMSQRYHKRTNTAGLPADTEHASSPPITIDCAATFSRNCPLLGPVEMGTIYPVRGRGGVHVRST